MKNKKWLVVMLAIVIAFECFPIAARAAEDSHSYYFGKSTEYSTFNQENSTLNDSYYFSENWFQEEPSERNDALALVSMQLTAAAVEESSDGNAGAFLKGLGFSDINFINNAKQDPESCNYLYGTKTMANGRMLVAVVIQSYTENSAIKEQGWKQNFIVNSENSTSGEHYALALAADKVIGDIEALGDQNSIFWVMGQSRGAALANLIAKRLGDRGDDVFAYTFEAPAIVDADAVTQDCGYIHNYICRDDLVTKIPVWGMTRYGNEYELKTDETDEHLPEELAKLGSEAAKLDVPDSESIETNILEYLSGRVATREEYSMIRIEQFTDPDTGDEVSITFSYQDSLVNLMGVVFSGELTGVSEVLLNHLEDVALAVNELLEAVKKDGTIEALPCYYEAAKDFHAFLDQISEKPLSLSTEDLYALLRLIGPFAVDTDYEPLDLPEVDLFGYLMPALNVALDIGGITYSHNFDTLIARLKTLAPAPELEDIDIIITAPKAGDDVGLAAEKVNAFFENDLFADANDVPWVRVSAAWDTDDQSLQDNTVYYLDVTLETIGHTVPEDFLMKLNGESPYMGPFISYDEASAVIRVRFELELGETPEVEISFDTDGKTETPDPITVKKGSSLITKEPPEITEIVTTDDGKYILTGWFDENGTPWDEIKVNEPMTVYAKWLIYVDYLDISFETPEFGDTMQEATVPEDAPYYIMEQDFSDPEYCSTDEALIEGEYVLDLTLALKDPDNSVFALDMDDPEDYIYIGNATINGEKFDEPDFDTDLFNAMLVSYEYYDDESYIRVTYYFPVVKEEPVKEAEYTFSEGNSQTWTKGSEQSAVFVVERSDQDEETFDHFTELQIDNATVSEDAYSVERGSLILDLKASYLEMLSEGKHILTVVFDDGKAEAEFTVAATQKQDEDSSEKDDNKDDTTPPTPSGDQDDEKPVNVNTGDISDILILFILMAVSAISIMKLMIKRRRS